MVWIYATATFYEHREVIFNPFDTSDWHVMSHLANLFVHLHVWELFIRNHLQKKSVRTDLGI